MTEAVSLRSNKSESDNYEITSTSPPSQYPRWQDDGFYEGVDRPSSPTGTVSSSKSHRSKHNMDKEQILHRKSNTIRSQGYETGHVLNNNDTAQYVLYYGKRSASSSDLQNYHDFDRNDLYGKVVK